jgi:hypothetical protein
MREFPSRRGKFPARKLKFLSRRGKFLSRKLAAPAQKLGFLAQKRIDLIQICHNSAKILPESILKVAGCLSSRRLLKRAILFYNRNFELV